MVFAMERMLAHVGSSGNMIYSEISYTDHSTNYGYQSDYG